jgi:hypothetical protein
VDIVVFGGTGCKNVSPNIFCGLQCGEIFVIRRITSSCFTAAREFFFAVVVIMRCIISDPYMFEVKFD